MKALVRNSEIIKESNNLPGINWNTGAPFTDHDFFRGPYQLIEDYHDPENPPSEEILKEFYKLDSNN